MLFGAAYYPEHRDPEKWEYDLDRMAEAHVNCVRVGEFAWVRFEPDDGDYDFEWMERFNTLAAARGVQLLMCPPLRTLPAWLVEEDPGLLIVREDGVRLEYGSRYTFCINHPRLREKGEALAAAMARQWADSENIVGWHLDNEHGDEPDCHCPICREKFQEWCKERYGSIDALNKAWGLVFWSLEFQHWGQIPTPAVSKTYHSPGHLLAWRRFRSACTIETVRMQAEALRRHIPERQFVTTNNQTWNPFTDYYEMDALLDISGTNYYPPYGDGSGFDPWAMAACRGYKRQNFQVHELRNGPHMIPCIGRNTPVPGEIERLTLHCVGNGADAAFYFRWRAVPFGCEQTHASLTDYDGRPKRAYEEAQRIGKNLKRLRPLLEGTSVRSEIAVLYDFPTRWVMESGAHWNGPVKLYMDLCRRLHMAVRARRVNCDVIGRGQTFTDYKVLVIPALATMNDALAEKLTEFVEQGGVLVWHPLCGIKDEEARIYDDRIHPRLKELLGVEIREFATGGPDEEMPFVWADDRYAGGCFCDLPEVQEEEIATGQFVETWFAGRPAVIDRVVGEGRAVYIATWAEPRFYHDLFDKLIQHYGLRRILGAEIPESIEVVERSSGDGRRLVFLINSSAEQQMVPLPEGAEDVYYEEPIVDSTVLEPLGARIISMPPEK